MVSELISLRIQLAITQSLVFRDHGYSIRRDRCLLFNNSVKWFGTRIISPGSIAYDQQLMTLGFNDDSQTGNRTGGTLHRAGNQFLKLRRQAVHGLPADELRVEIKPQAEAQSLLIRPAPTIQFEFEAIDKGRPAGD